MDNYYTKYIKYKSKYLELKGVTGNVSIYNGNNGAYYTKYIKYKTKYIKEKGLVGGELGNKPCPTTFGFVYERSVGYYLRNYNCTYNDLSEKILNKLNEFTRDVFQRTNEKHPQQQITITDLKNRGFPAKFLKDNGFLLAELKEGGFNASKLKEGGFSVGELKKAKFSIGKLKEAKFSIGELKEEFNIFELKQAGFTLQELKAHFTLRQLNVHFPLREIIKIMVSLEELKDAGFDASELAVAGFDARALNGVGFDLPALKGAGFNASALKAVGFSASALKGVGFDASALKGAEYDLPALKGAGFDALALKVAGFSASALKGVGFDASALKAAGFDASALKRVGYSVTVLKVAGYSASALREAGFTVSELKVARFTFQQLNKAGYSNDDLTIAGYIFHIDESGNTVLPSIYIADDNLLSDPQQLQTLLKNSDKRIQFFNNDEEIYYKFYTLLTEYVYEQYGNKENMTNLKSNWKISLYACNTDPLERHNFLVSQFTQSQHEDPQPKPRGIWGSELYNNEKSSETWIGFLSETNYMGNGTGYPNNCSFLIFRLYDSDKILHVLGGSNFNDTYDFEDASAYLAKYKKKNTKFENFENFGFTTYDWTQIAKDYDALNIQTYIKIWDVRSTVVWNESVVAEYHFLTLQDLPFVKGFVNCEQLFSDANK